MSNPLKAKLLFPRVHEACYMGHCVKFESRANINSPLGFTDLMYEGLAALKRNGIKPDNGPYNHPLRGVSVDGYFYTYTY